MSTFTINGLDLRDSPVLSTSQDPPIIVSESNLGFPPEGLVVIASKIRDIRKEDTHITHSHSRPI